MERTAGQHWVHRQQQSSQGDDNELPRLPLDTSSELSSAYPIMSSSQDPRGHPQQQQQDFPSSLQQQQQGYTDRAFSASASSSPSMLPAQATSAPRPQQQSQQQQQQAGLHTTGLSNIHGQSNVSAATSTSYTAHQPFPSSPEKGKAVMLPSARSSVEAGHRSSSSVHRLKQGQHPSSSQLSNHHGRGEERSSGSYQGQYSQQQQQQQRKPVEGSSSGQQGRSQALSFPSSGSSRMASSADLVPQQSNALALSQPLRSRIFGLTVDLQPQAEFADPAFFPGGIVPPEAITAAGRSSPASKQQPNFSVELKAQSFDHRGYPVYSGQAAGIAGIVRMRKSEASDVVVKISAHTTTGSAAAVWDGVALQPPESGTERTVFASSDRLSVSEGKVESIQAARVPSRGTSESSSDSDDTEILAIPFLVNMPMGKSTRVVDGNATTVTVALPPSFELSSEQDNRDKAFSRSLASSVNSAGNSAPTSGSASIKTSRTKMTAITLRDAVETGLQQVYRVGCFYRITFTLAPAEGKQADRKRKMSGVFGSKKNKSKQKEKGSTVISVPFVFLGEPTPMPPMPSSLPPILPMILKTPSTPLASGWISETATAKWSGMLFKTLKRNVDLELFLPGLIVQAPSVVPILLIVRPEDPGMLPAFHPHQDTSPESPRPGGSGALAAANHFGDATFDLANASSAETTGRFEETSLAPGGRQLGLLSPKLSPVLSRSLDDEQPVPTAADKPDEVAAEHSGDEQSEVGKRRRGLDRFIKSSLSLSRSSANNTAASATKDSSSASIHSVSRDTSAPQQQAQAAGSSTADAKSIRKKTSRSTFSLMRRPNTAPSTRSDGSNDGSYTVRRGETGSGSGSSGSNGPIELCNQIRVSLLQNIYYSSSTVNEPPKNKRRLVSVADLEEIDLSKLAEGGYEGVSLCKQDGVDRAAVLAEAKTQGVRALRGLLKVGREATPSFRVQGIELKYAIKVDLLPFSPASLKQQHQNMVIQAARTAAASSRSSNPSSSPPGTPPAVGMTSSPFRYPTASMQSTLQGTGSKRDSNQDSSDSSNTAGSRSTAPSSIALSTNPSQASTIQRNPQQQYGHRSQLSGSTTNSNWIPPNMAAMNISSSTPAASSTQLAGNSSRAPSHRTAGPAESVSGGGGEVLGRAYSEAGFSRRSPSDQTVLGPDSVKLHKSVGALWVNVRMVKGKGAL